MKKTILILTIFSFSFSLQAQNVVGAWETYFTTIEGEQLRSVVIFTDKYQVQTTYNANTGEFKDTNGGSWSLSGNIMTEKVEFDSKNTDRVGSETSINRF